MLNHFDLTEETAFIYQKNGYQLIRKVQNVQRGEFDNLTCAIFRNEENRHSIKVYYTANQIEYVESGYSLTA